MKIPEMPKSGKCGGKVWQRRRHGYSSHALVIPANPGTPAQITARGIWSVVFKRWRKLTQAQRDCWIAAAKTRNSRPNIEQEGPLTGCQLFGMINVALSYFGRAQVDLPPKYPRFPRLAISGLVVTNVANVIQISLCCSRDPGNCTILRASLPVSARRKVCTDFRVIGFRPPPEHGFAEITSLYTAKFRAPRVGSRLFIQVNQIIDGWEDTPRVFTAIVPPPA